MNIRKTKFAAIFVAVIAAAGVLFACSVNVTTIPSYVPDTDTTPEASSSPVNTEVITDVTLIPTPTPVFPTDTAPDKAEVEATLLAAINEENVNVIVECIKIFPELLSENNASIETAVLGKTDKFITLCSSEEYSSEKLTDYKYLGYFKTVISESLSKAVTAITEKYVNENMNEELATISISRIYGLEEFASEREAANSSFAVVKNDKNTFDSAIAALNNGDSEQALTLFSKIKEGYFYTKAQEKIAYIKADSVKLAMIEKAIARYKLLDYEGAIANLEKVLEKYENDETATNLLKVYNKEFEEFKKDTELFSVRNIRSVFTHSLIAFPEIELKNEKNAHGDLDCLTPNEFRAILKALYNSNYVLIDYRLMYEIVEDDDGNEVLEMRSKIRVPKGKKPLVLSIDAVFNTANEGRGLTDKVILKDGKIASYTKLKSGEEVISFDNEVFGILDSFVEAHPDFSFNGAKCVVAPTGYYGFLGHQVQKYSDFYKKIENPPEVRAQAIEEAKELIEHMLNNGYTFGSHTYSHPHMKDQTADELRAELQAWQDEIGYLLGDVDFYIYPFGEYGKETGNEKLNNVIHEFGFYVFNGCGAACYNINGFPWDRSQDVIFIDRFTLAGQTLRYYGDGKKSWIKEWDLLLTDGTTPEDIYDHENRYVKYGS